MRLVFPHTAKSRIPRQFELDPNVEKAIIAGAGWLANIIVSSHKSLTDVEKTLQKDICEVDKKLCNCAEGFADRPRWPAELGGAADRDAEGVERHS